MPSEPPPPAPPPPTTGTSSTDSRDSPKAALQQEMTRNAGVVRLGRMAAVESLGRNLAAEDAAVKRSIERHERELSEGDAEQTEPDDNMRIMAGGDVRVYLPPADSAPIATPQPRPGRAPTLAKAAIAAALIASGIGAGVGVPWALGMFDQQSPAPQKYELRLEVE